MSLALNGGITDLTTWR